MIDGTEKERLENSITVPIILTVKLDAFYIHDKIIPCTLTCAQLL